MKIKFKYKNKTINLEVKKCNLLQKIIGLMFTRREKANCLLLFDSKKSHRLKIHSFFVFFPFLAVWLNSDGKVVEKRIVKPWNPLVFPKKDFVRLIEIPMNKKNSKLIRLLVGDAKHL